MHNKFLLLILFLFIPNIILGKNYMMNCFSPDFRTAAFYKFDSTNKKLFMRTVKKKWKDFCDFNSENEQNEKKEESLIQKFLNIFNRK